MLSQQCCNSCRMKLIYHVSFLCETHENLLALWNTGQYFITLLAGLFSAKITNKKHKNMKNTFTYDSWNRKHLLVWPQLETCDLVNSNFSPCISVNCFKSALSIDLGVTNKLWPIGEFENMESANYRDQLCKCGLAHCFIFWVCIVWVNFQDSLSIVFSNSFVMIDLICFAKYSS